MSSVTHGIRPACSCVFFISRARSMCRSSTKLRHCHQQFRVPGGGSRDWLNGWRCFTELSTLPPQDQGVGSCRPPCATYPREPIRMSRSHHPPPWSHHPLPSHPPPPSSHHPPPPPHPPLHPHPPPLHRQYPSARCPRSCPPLRLPNPLHNRGHPKLDLFSKQVLRLNPPHNREHPPM